MFICGEVVLLLLKQENVTAFLGFQRLKGGGYKIMIIFCYLYELMSMLSVSFSTFLCVQRICAIFITLFSPFGVL